MMQFKEWALGALALALWGAIWIVGYCMACPLDAVVPTILQ